MSGDPHPHDSGAFPRRARRPIGSGKTTFARKHFLPTEVLSSDSCRGLVTDDENDQAATNDAFELLHFIAGQAAGRRAADGDRRHQRPARGPQAAGRAGPRSITACRSPSSSTCPSSSARSGTASGPTATSARTSSATRRRSCAASLRGLAARGLPPRLRARHRRRRSRRPTIERVPLWNDRTRRARPVRHHRRRPRLLRRARAAARRARLRGDRAARRRVPGRRARLRPPGRAARRSSSATSSTAGRGSSTRVRLVRNMVEAGSAVCVPGNHDMKLLAQAARARRADHPRARPNRWPRSTRCPTSVASPFAKALAEFLDGLVSHYVLDDGRLVVAHAGHEGGDAGPRLRQGARLRPLRRDDRRDRRVRPAGALQLGGRVPRPGDGRLRPHAGPRAGVAQPHGQHRHRLRLRRQADRPALPGEGVRLASRQRRPTASRPGRSCPRTSRPRR